MQNEMIFRNLPPQEILQLLIGVAKRLTDSRVLLVLHVLEITCKDQIKSDCEASSVARSSAATFRAGHFLTENRSPNRTEPNRTESVGFSVFGFGFGFYFLSTEVLSTASVFLAAAPKNRRNRAERLLPSCVR